jgi:hypothetical protein
MTTLGIGVDLMVFDILENLSISKVSSLLISILDWNQMDEEFLVLVINFVSTHVHDDGVLLLFQSDAKIVIPSVRRPFGKRTGWAGWQPCPLRLI